MKGNHFWGLFFIIMGSTFIVNRFLDLNIPVFTTMASFALIFWGIYIIRNGFGIRTEKEIVFSEGEIKDSAIQDKYDIIFSNGAVNLMNIPAPAVIRRIKIDTIFARGTIRINPDIPTFIKVSSAFASARMPNNTFTSFGSCTYTTKNYREGSPYILVEADVVFGQLEVIEY